MTNVVVLMLVLFRIGCALDGTEEGTSSQAEVSGQRGGRQRNPKAAEVTSRLSWVGRTGLCCLLRSLHDFHGEVKLYPWSVVPASFSS